jgi:hypothetical protein
MGASEKSAATFHPDDRPVGEVPPERTDSTLLDRYKAEMRVSVALRAEVARLTVERDVANDSIDAACVEAARLRAGIKGLAGTWGRLAANGPATFAGIRRRHAAELCALLDGEVRP